MKRPTSFDEFHGQANAVAQLKVPAKAAQRSGKIFGHTLLSGPRGLGKTTLAGVIATEMKAPVTSLNAAAIEKPQQLLNALTLLKAGQVLFLDEIHMLQRGMHEHLYTAMEDRKLTIVLGEGKDAKAYPVDLEPFTLVGATTREGLLPAPLLDRFKHTVRLDLYDDREMAEVLKWICVDTGFTIDAEALATLVPACHGTARHAVTLLDAATDTFYAIDEGNLPKEIDGVIARGTLSRLGFRKGLNKNEIELLKQLASGPKGLTTLAAVLDEEAITVETVYEPWLLRKGLIVKKPGGREITQAGLDAIA